MKKIIGLLLVVLLSFSSQVDAGGYELVGVSDALSLGRGGASLTRADSANLLFSNPANLVRLRHKQAAFSLFMPFGSTCFDKSGSYGKYAEVPAFDKKGSNRVRIAPDNTENAFGKHTKKGIYNQEVPEVCNNYDFNLLPRAALSWQVMPKLTIGFGVWAPLAFGNLSFGEETQIDGKNYKSTTNNLPNATRYMFIDRKLLIAYPTIGFGYQVMDDLDIGLSFGSGLANVEMTLIGRAFRGEDFNNDLHAEINAKDLFVPRVVVSMQAQILESLSLAASFVWQGNIDLTGELAITSGYYLKEEFETLKVKDVQFHASQPWKIDLALSYNHLKESTLLMADENKKKESVFDVEFGFTYERNSVVDELYAKLPENTDAKDGYHRIDIGVGAPLQVPKKIGTDYNWKDQMVFRLGGDYNLVPNLFSLRAGLSYETKGVEEGYERVDFMPFERYGVFLGATYKPTETLSISLGYGFLYQPEVVVTDAKAKLREVNAESYLQREQEDYSLFAGEPTVINAGSYTSNFHLLSLGMNYQF